MGPEKPKSVWECECWLWEEHFSELSWEKIAPATLVYIRHLAQDVCLFTFLSHITHIVTLGDGTNLWKNIKEMGSTFEFVKIYRTSSAPEIFKNALSIVFRAWITREGISWPQQGRGNQHQVIGGTQPASHPKAQPARMWGSERGFTSLLHASPSSVTKMLAPYIFHGFLLLLWSVYPRISCPLYLPPKDASLMFRKVAGLTKALRLNSRHIWLWFKLPINISLHCKHEIFFKQLFL